RGTVVALGLGSDLAVVLLKVRRCKVRFSPAAGMATARSRVRNAKLTHQLRGFGFEVFVRREAVDQPAMLVAHELDGDRETIAAADSAVPSEEEARELGGRSRRVLRVVERDVD